MLFQSLAQQQEKGGQEGSGSGSSPSPTPMIALPQPQNGTGVTATQTTGLKLGGTGISTGFKLGGGAGLNLGGTGIPAQAYQAAQAPQEAGMKIGGGAGMKLGGMGGPTHPSGFKLSGGFLSGEPLFQAQPPAPQVGMGKMPVFDYYSSSSGSDSNSDKDENYSGSESEGEYSEESSYSSITSDDDNIINNINNNNNNFNNEEQYEQYEENEENEDNEGITITTTTKKRKSRKSRRNNNNTNTNMTGKEKKGSVEGGAVPRLEIKDSPYTLLNSGREFANWGGSAEGNEQLEESLAQSRIDSLSWERTAGSTYTRLGAAAVVDHSGTADSLSVPQALTVKDWFMILDAQIRSSGLNVSLSELYLRKFEDEDITMHTLPFLTEKDLIDMGVSKMGHRKLIMSSIAKIPKSGQSVFVSSSSASSLAAPKPLLEMSDAPPPPTLPSAAGNAAYPSEGGALRGYTCLSANQQGTQLGFGTQGTNQSAAAAAAAMQNPLVKHGLMQRHQKSVYGGGGGGGSSMGVIVPENSTILVNGSEGKMQNILCIDDVKIGKKIGEGSFGEVFQAVWHGNVVAAKKTKECNINNDLISEYSVNNHFNKHS